tara:strand:+ start:230 stop:2101 length:1872 start_codon:yes stop_codon:yes gene_type:complete
MSNVYRGGGATAFQTIDEERRRERLGEPKPQPSMTAIQGASTAISAAKTADDMISRVKLSREKSLVDRGILGGKNSDADASLQFQYGGSPAIFDTDMDGNTYEVFGAEAGSNENLFVKSSGEGYFKDLKKKGLSENPLGVINPNYSGTPEELRDQLITSNRFTEDEINNVVNKYSIDNEAKFGLESVEPTMIDGGNIEDSIMNESVDNLTGVSDMPSEMLSNIGDPKSFTSTSPFTNTMTASPQGIAFDNAQLTDYVKYGRGFKAPDMLDPNTFPGDYKRPPLSPHGESVSIDEIEQTSSDPIGFGKQSPGSPGGFGVEGDTRLQTPVDTRLNKELKGTMLNRQDDPYGAPGGTYNQPLEYPTVYASSGEKVNNLDTMGSKKKKNVIKDKKSIFGDKAKGEGLFGKKDGFGSGKGLISQIGKGGDRFGGKFLTGEGKIAKKISNIGSTVKGIGQGVQNLSKLGHGGGKAIMNQVKGKLAAKFGAKAATTAATSGAAAATGAAAASAAASQGIVKGFLTGMGPAGWALSALSLLGGKLFKPHTALGKVFSIFSDERLKKNIKHVGNSPSGIPIVDFEYIDSMNIPGKFRGVLSKHVPQARQVHPAYGFDLVDYNKIDVEFKRIK